MTVMLRSTSNVFTRLQTHTCTHTHIHTYTHTHIRTYTHTHIHTYTHTHTPSYTHTHIPTYPHTHILTYSHTHILTFPHTRIHAGTVRSLHRIRPPHSHMDLLWVGTSNFQCGILCYGMRVDVGGTARCGTDMSMFVRRMRGDVGMCV